MHSLPFCACPSRPGLMNGHRNYDSAIKFELKGVVINTIILFVSDKN